MSNKSITFISPHALANMPSDSPVLVALSGGADSCALIHILYEYARKQGFRLCAAHVNHNIRTDDYDNEALRDENFCRDLCQRLGVELFIGRPDIPTAAKLSGNSIESEAREQRYRFFSSIMSEHGIRILATAHNADDNLETQIFNLARGCSADGIRGIPTVRRMFRPDGALIVRPLISSTKNEILEFCRCKGIEYVTDSTNLEDGCTRNRIRHNIIPELVKLFNSPQRASLRLSAAIDEDIDYINKQALDYLKDRNGNLCIRELIDLHPALAKRVIIRSYKKECNAQLEAVHIEGIMGLIRGGKNLSSVSLPGGLRAIIKDGKLMFEANTKDPSFITPDFCVELRRGINIISNTPFALVISDTAPSGTVDHNGVVYKLYSSSAINDRPTRTLHAKNRQSGDLILHGGVHKKIKKMMCDKKVPITDRNSLPLVHRDNEVIYVPLCAVADTARSVSGEKHIIVTIYKETSEAQNDTGR